MSMMPATAAQRMPSQQANFHEKALFVKADLATSGSPSLTGSALRAMLPSALSVSQLSSDSVHYGIRLGSDYQQGAAIFATVSPTPRRGGPSSQLAHSPCARDPKRSDRGRPSCHFRVLAVVPGLPPFL